MPMAVWIRRHPSAADIRRAEAALADYPINTHDDAPLVRNRIAQQRLRAERREVFGGDLSDCLSDQDLDRGLAILGHHAVPARLFFDLRTGEISAASFRRTITRALALVPWTIVPVHVMHHWVTGIAVRTTGGCLRMHLYDSAPTPAVQMMIAPILQSAKVELASYRSLGRQPLGCNECGIHTA